MALPHVDTRNTPTDGRFSRTRFVNCSQCGAEGTVADWRLRPEPDVWALNELTKKGWVDTHTRRIKCPDCAKAARSEIRETKTMKKPNQTQPVDLSGAHPIPAGLKLDSPEGRAALVTIRVPTRDERRRMHDALSVAYDEQNERYFGTQSDKSVAESLNMPWHWIKEVREQFFGPDGCEAEAKARIEFAQMKVRAKAIEDDALAVAARAEAFGKDLERLTANLTRKAG